jgi:F-type H+-transporting ATPase subunit a
MAASHFTLFDLAHVPHEYTYVAANVAVTGLLVAFSVAAKLSLGHGEAAVTPAARFSIKGLAEVIVEFMDNLTREVVGQQARKYVPLFGALFLFIAISNLFGLLPGMTAATSNINAALAIGLFSFLTYNIIGLKHGGWHYVAHFFGPVWWLAWLMLPIELISHSVRPLSLGMRLSINMTADHTILGTFLDLTKVFVPVIFYGMGTFVSLVQAFVFTMLSMVYVSLATEDEH